MKGASLKPCTTASSCITTSVELPHFWNRITQELRQIESTVFPVSRRVLAALAFLPTEVNRKG
jgi:hypothetical protein